MTIVTSAEFERIKAEAIVELATAKDAALLEAWRIKYIGRSGLVPQLLRQVKDVPVGERAQVGAAANAVRAELTQMYEQAVQQIKAAATNKPEPSPPDFAKASAGAAPLPSPPPSPKEGRGEATTSFESRITDNEHAPGHLHPLTQTCRSIAAILTNIGFTLVEGPLLEDTQHNFDNLNIGPEHPSRAEKDTFYVQGSIDRNNRRVLRTETSSVQVRAVQELGLTPPFKIFTLGRVFRNEKVDATHSHTFHQLEVLAIGPNVTVADFKGTVEALFSKFFGSEAKTRLRPHYFPFTEPSFEVDLQCVFCTTGCHVCKGSRWIEIGGAGMVHPNVIRTMGLDPAEQQGFAWGFGVERHAMLKHGINDVRLFLDNDLRFLRQF